MLVGTITIKLCGKCPSIRLKKSKMDQANIKVGYVFKLFYELSIKFYETNDISYMKTVLMT